LAHFISLSNIKDEGNTEKVEKAVEVEKKVEEKAPEVEKKVEEKTPEVEKKVEAKET